MKDFVLICSTLAVFVFGFFVARRVDLFLAESRRLAAQDALSRYHLVQVATETTSLLNAVAPAMMLCSSTEPDLEFAVTGGQPGCLLQKLRAGEVDLALLAQAPADSSKHLACLQVPVAPTAASEKSPVSPDMANADRAVVYVLWDPAVHSLMRDRLLDALRLRQV